MGKIDALLKGPFEEAINEGGRIRHQWYDELVAVGSAHQLRVRLKNFQTLCSENSIKLARLLEGSEHYEEAALFEQIYQGKLFESISVFRRQVEALPDPLAGDPRIYFQHCVDEFYTGIIALGHWANVRKQDVVRVRADLAARAAN